MEMGSRTSQNDIGNNQFLQSGNKNWKKDGTQFPLTSNKRLWKFHLPLPRPNKLKRALRHVSLFEDKGQKCFRSSFIKHYNSKEASWASSKISCRRHNFLKCFLSTESSLEEVEVHALPVKMRFWSEHYFSKDWETEELITATVDTDNSYCCTMLNPHSPEIFQEGLNIKVLLTRESFQKVWSFPGQALNEPGLPGG